MFLRILFFILCFISSAFATAKELKVAMGTKLPPMHFFDASGNLTGFEVDLVTLYAKERNMQAVFLDPAKYNTSSLDMVLSGKADMAVNCMAITDDRKQFADFSEPYFASGAAILTRVDASVPFNFYKRTYLVIKNSLYAKLLADKYLSNRKEVVNIEEAFSLLDNEKLPHYLPYAFVFDWTALQEVARKKSDMKLADFLIAKEEYGAAFRRSGSRSNIDTWNNFLARVRQDGRYQHLFKKWFAETSLPEIAKIPQEEYKASSHDWPDTLMSEIIPGGYIAEYLPILNSDLSLSKHSGGSKVADKYYAYLLKHYSKKWLPHLEELFSKGYLPGNGPMLYDFIVEKDVTDMLPLFYKSPDEAGSFRSEKIDQTLSIMAAKHPGLRSEIEKTYVQHLEQRSVHISFPPGCVDENNSRINITVLPDNKAQQPVTVNISMGNDADIRLLPGKPGGPSRITINGITGTLKEMVVSGDMKMSIVNIGKGVIDSYSLPDDCKYIGMSKDGATIYLEFKKFLLFLDVKSHNITRIEIANPMKDQKLLDYAYGKIAGLYDFKTIRSDKEDVYYLEHTGTGEFRMNVYRRSASSPDMIKMPSFLGNATNPFVLDNKLFTSDLGYDSCAPFNVVDLKTGHKLDTGYCGGIVPVGPHELYYCAPGGWQQHPNEYWIVNTETLKRERIRELPCPGKTGSFAPHPLPGYFIYFSWALC